MFSVKRWGGSIQLPTTVRGAGKFANFSGNGFLTDDETNIHRVGEIGMKMNANANGDTALPLFWGVREDV